MRPSGHVLPRGCIPAALAILAVAIGLRFWHLAWGLADGVWFPEEAAYCTARAAGFVPLRWQSFLIEDHTYPSLYGILGGLVTAAAHATGIITGPLSRETPSLFVVMRGVSAVAGVATVAATGLLGAC